MPIICQSLGSPVGFKMGRHMSSPQKHKSNIFGGEDGREIGGSRAHFPSSPVKHLTDLRNTAISQRYSSIYEDRRPKIEDIERSDSKKSA